jgi:hypothetical protein
MNFSELTFRLILVFLPGIVCGLLFDHLTARKERQAFSFTIHSFLLGTACYALLQLLTWITAHGQELTVVQFLSTPTAVHLELAEVAWAAFIAVPLAYVTAGVYNHKWLHRLARLMHLTSKFAEADVWEYFLNNRTYDWYVLRDSSTKVYYEGWIEAYSEAGEPRELLLREAKVFSDEEANRGELLYQANAIYIAGKPENLSLEVFPPPAPPQPEAAQHVLPIPRTDVGRPDNGGKPDR